MRSYKKKRERNPGAAKKRRGLRVLTVRVRPGNRSQGLLKAGTTVFPCALGRGGVSSNKREGDGATPLGRMPIVSGYFRRDHVAAGPTRLRMTPIHSRLGWCEVPDDRNYNRPVKIPYGASHETMCRSDRLYDYCLVLGWNISPRRRGRGSAIFFHLARPDFSPTQGCVAITGGAMARLLPFLSRDCVVTVGR